MKFGVILDSHIEKWDLILYSQLEYVGIQEIALMLPADYQRKVYRDVAELVLPAFR